MKGQKINFYAVIIGSEILNGRREDRHFAYLRDALLKKGYSLYGSFIIKDDPLLIKKVFTLIQKDPNGVMFSFGGIGATPDDLTREIAAEVFGDGKLYCHNKAKKKIEAQFGKDAYPNRILMAYLPKDAALLENPVNNVPGFTLKNRYFFMPGFPQMAHPMIKEALTLFPNNYQAKEIFCVYASENDILDIMKALPKNIEFSSLPSFSKEGYKTEIALFGKDKEIVQKWSQYFKRELQKREIFWSEGECK